MSTHILEEAEAICDRVLIINSGRLVKDGPTSSLVDKKGRLEETIRVFAS
jgi:ABC-2 type transport system ATP-binding protein